MKDFVQQTWAIELGFAGSQFTWINKQEGSASIQRRLDKAILSTRLLKFFPRAMMQHLNMEYSDHLPILLKTNGEEETYNRPFRLVQAWVIHISNFQVMKNAWETGPAHGMESYKTMCKLRATSTTLKVWNHIKFGITRLNSRT